MTLVGESIRAFAEERGNPVIVYCQNETSPKLLEAEDVVSFAGMLATVSAHPAVDVILHSDGGAIRAGRTFALLLRALAKRVVLFVPLKARSTGTLICLGADEVVASRSAEFSPIDPIVIAARTGNTNAPHKISSEDVRSFRLMAESWFDLKSEESRLQMLQILAGRIFPTTLAAFYRADKYARKVACELLRLQFPEARESELMIIADRIITGYSSHSDLISRDELISIGVRVSAGDPPEARMAAKVIAECQRAMAPSSPEHAPRQFCRCLFISGSNGLAYMNMAQEKAGGPPATLAGWTPFELATK